MFFVDLKPLSPLRTQQFQPTMILFRDLLQSDPPQELQGTLQKKPPFHQLYLHLVSTLASSAFERPRTLNRTALNLNRTELAHHYVADWSRVYVSRIRPYLTAQLLANNLDTGPDPRAPVFHICPQDSPTRKVTVATPFAGQGKWQGTRFGSPTRGRSRERSGSVEPKPPWNGSGTTAGPSDLGSSASKFAPSPVEEPQCLLDWLPEASPPTPQCDDSYQRAPEAVDQIVCKDVPIKARIEVRAMEWEQIFFTIIKRPTLIITRYDSLRLSGELKGEWAIKEKLCDTEHYSLVRIRERFQPMVTLVAIPRDFCSLPTPEDHIQRFYRQFTHPSSALSPKELLEIFAEISWRQDGCPPKTNPIEQIVVPRIPTPSRPRIVRQITWTVQKDPTSFEQLSS
ncbi:hypothetical protein DFH06DRAFT_1297446 [Mycena polygramma]|nr:hypothetical protein DFH06DRAFT_1297446 [Mycena polygramma]